MKPMKANRCSSRRGTRLTLAVVLAGLLLLAVSLPARGADDPARRPDSGSYGEKTVVASQKDARKIIRKNYARKNVTIGIMTERQLYFEAELLDESGRVIDRIAVDKRTGRIRSIY